MDEGTKTFELLWKRLPSLPLSSEKPLNSSNCSKKPRQIPHTIVFLNEFETYSSKLKKPMRSQCFSSPYFGLLAILILNFSVGCATPATKQEYEPLEQEKDWTRARLPLSGQEETDFFRIRRHYSQKELTQAQQKIEKFLTCFFVFLKFVFDEV